MSKLYLEKNPPISTRTWKYKVHNLKLCKNDQILLQVVGKRSKPEAKPGELWENGHKNLQVQT